METNKEELIKKKLESTFTEDVLELGQEYMQRYMKSMAYYRCAMMEIETKLNVLNEEFSLRYDRNPINSMKSRLKSVRSIQNKLETRRLPVSIASMDENLNDIAGVRVICSFTEDVYTIADALLNQDDIVLVERKDYIKNPKPNGYRSLHLIVTVPIFFEKEKHLVKVEIQLRTIAMDSWASLEHQLRYKKDYDFDHSMADELKRCSDLSAELDERMDRLRASVQSENPEDFQ